MCFDKGDASDPNPIRRTGLKLAVRCGAGNHSRFATLATRAALVADLPAKPANRATRF
jgi:hypothetical protein